MSRTCDFLLSPALLSDALLISLLRLHRYSCCSFPGARVPPAATRRGTRPSRKRDRHVRCESHALADGFRPGLARSCLFLPERPTDECLSTGCERPWLGFAISPSVLLPNYSLLSTGLPAGSPDGGSRNSWLLAAVAAQSRTTYPNLNSSPPQTRFNDDDLCERNYLD